MALERQKFTLIARKKSKLDYNGPVERNFDELFCLIKYSSVYHGAHCSCLLVFRAMLSPAQAIS